MARRFVNREMSGRQREPEFSELAAQSTLGPDVSTSTSGGEAVLAGSNTPVDINQWTVMTQADQGLLDSIYNFINTTKEGESVVPDTLNGRTKKLFFNFYGTMGKSVKPGEIGQFEVNFTYPPQTAVDTGGSGGFIPQD